MLWYKAWLELRLRVALTGAMVCLVLWQVATSPKSAYTAAARDPRTAAFLDAATRTALASHSPQFITLWLAAFYHVMPLFLSILAVAFASAGLKTQTPFANARESHPSMFFTLSLPVSRLHLLLTRSIAGLCAVVFVALLMVTVSSVVAGAAPGADVLPMIAGSIIGATVFFAISTLLSVYLADLWQIYAGYAVFGLYMYTWYNTRVPPAIDFFRLMNGEFYLVNGHLPISTVLVSVAVIAALFYATLLCMRRKEF